MKEGIRIYVRLKPLSVNGQKHGCQYQTTHEPDDPTATHTPQQDTFQLAIPKLTTDGYVNNSRELFRFHFDGVLESDVSQASVFETVAKPIVERALDGYNGTVFAYGQTGSGKTFTITGNGAQENAPTAKGIIPRTLSYVFLQLSKDTSSWAENSISLSYFEIYNEAAYDLLRTRDSLDKSEDLAKIQLLEDADQNIHLRNLSVHRVNNETDAMKVLAVGEANRVMAETPMNQTSTRSHCIFTIIINRRDAESSIVRTSKLHIVDLAGSERVHKSGIAGRSLTEAKCINLALHHLEQVIIALADKTRVHVPYRNSIMTSILKDSLGGNSLTSMIATCSLEEVNVGETISTCRFAQRVALIRNEVVRNELVDPMIEIELLKNQLQQARNTCFLLHGDGDLPTGPLTQEQHLECEQHVDSFLAHKDLPDDMVVGLDWRKIQCCFRLIRKKTSSRTTMALKTEEARDGPNKSAEDSEIKKLQNTLEQRDREMAILCKLLRQEKKRIDGLLVHSTLDNAPINSVREISTPLVPMPFRIQPSPPINSVVTPPVSRLPVEFRPPPDYRPWLDELPQLNETQQFDLRRALMAKFIDSHAQRGRVEELTQNLTDRVSQARLLGANIRTAQVEQQRRGEQLDALRQAGDPRAEAISWELDYERSRLQEMLNQLRALKGQVEYFETLIREATKVMQAQFDQWWSHALTSGGALNKVQDIMD